MSHPKYFFIQGFYYTFGLADNPIIQIMKNRNQRTDMDSIKSDWAKIGNDIKKVYERETATIG